MIEGHVSTSYTKRVEDLTPARSGSRREPFFEASIGYGGEPVTSRLNRVLREKHPSIKEGFRRICLPEKTSQRIFLSLNFFEFSK
jgi:hypothetical protein